MNAQNVIGGMPSTIGLPIVKAFMPTIALTTVDQDFILRGITLDSAGAALGGCTVHVCLTQSEISSTLTTSDPTTGIYALAVQPPPTTYYAVAYKAGSPDVAGTTVNTLVGA